MSEKQRLDVALVSRGLCASREKAQATILSGVVFLNNQRADKASLSVEPSDVLEVRGAVHPYVSRGGLKLEKALKVFPIDVKGVIAMDVGASTGGFTDVLLQNGAQQVYSIDVGYGQLDWKLRSDSRVVVMERTNARHLTIDSFPTHPTLAVMDVSFISIRLILPSLMNILGESGRILTLVKPQFEAGRNQVGKKGVVRDPAVHESVLQEILSFLSTTSYRAQGIDFSPITGPEGNIEFLLDLAPAPSCRAAVSAEDVPPVVAAAHQAHKS